MANLKVEFRGLNSDLYGNATPSGTCISTLNTIVKGNTTLEGRQSFNVYDADSSTLGNILNMFVASFASGVTYLVTKRSDGKLYHQQVYPTKASVWLLIKNRHASNLHSTTDRGFFYMWADRMYYFDRIGGTKWDGTSASTTGTGVYKAGMECPKAPTIEAASGGGKDGWYHVACTLVNTKTGAESVMQGMQTGGAVNTRISSATGGINITNWRGAANTYVIDTGNLNFEFDQVGVYCSLGNTERAGTGNGVEQFSYQMYREVVVPKTYGTTSWSGLYRMDAIIQNRLMATNHGGAPPGALFGSFNGSRAVYFEVYPKSSYSPTLAVFGANTLASGVAMYSKAGFPTMVPQDQRYDIAGAGNDYQIIEPQGGANEISTGINGKVTGCGHVGSRFVVFTSSATYSMAMSDTGKMRVLPADLSHGAVGYGPVVQTPRSLHALGSESWLRVSSDGMRDVANDQFSSTLALIPSASRTVSVGGYYGHRNEVWFAVAKAGGTASKAQRILVYDDTRQALVSIFEPANLGTTGIKAMCELSTPTTAPVMLVAMDDGVILTYPGDDVLDGASSTYACHWQG